MKPTSHHLIICTWLHRLLIISLLPTPSTALAQDPSPHHTQAADQIASHYQIENLPMPAGVSAEVGGMDFTPSGKLAACFHHGGVYLFDLNTSRWTQFATGLHDPLGLIAVSDTEIIVLQRAELTRLIDTNADGTADRYETLSESFGVSGNYHEFPFGPAKGPDGNLFIALGHASNGQGSTVQQEMRGAINPHALPNRSKYAIVPYRGWVLRIDPTTGQATPFADGFREPNGIGFDPEGRLFVVDNQGDYVGTSKLYLVERGAFYGHPASLVWRSDSNRAARDPYTIPLEQLNTFRKRAAVLIPHGSLANSPTQPVWDTTAGRFGPFTGQLFIGEMNTPRLLRVMLEEVGGTTQGAVTTFYENAELAAGNNRMVFGPDGALYIGQTQRVGKWVGGSGIQRLVYTGSPPPGLMKFELTATGFRLTFTTPIDPITASNAVNYSFHRYRYHYHAKYGSDQIDRTEIVPIHAALSDNGLTVTLTLPPDTLRTEHVFELQMNHVRTAGNHVPIVNNFAAYTVQRLSD